MRSFLCVLIVILCVMHAAAQDLIVTDKGDSINCLITRVKPDYIYFTFKQDNEVRNTLLPVGRVKFQQKNFYQEAVVPPGSVPQKAGGRWFAIRAGWGHRTATIPEGTSQDVAAYIKKLKNGLNIYADAGFAISESLGLGLTYSGFTSKNSDPSISVNGFITSTSDKIWIHYVGPSTRSRFGNSDDYKFTSSFTLGLLAFHDNATLGSSLVELSGQSVGLGADLGVEIKINETKDFILSFSLFAGSLGKLKITSGSQTTTQTLDPDERENLTRFNLSAGLRFNR